MKAAFVIVGLASVVGCVDARSGKEDGGSSGSGSGGSPSMGGSDGSAAGPSSGGSSAGSGALDPATYVSGTRIKIRKTVKTTRTADGSRVSETSFAGWLDTARNEFCEPAVASDGKLRCLPITAPVGVTNSAFVGYFADATCTTPVVLSRITDDYCLIARQPNYVAFTDRPAGSCAGAPPSWKLYRSGAEVFPVYSKSGTSCVSVQGYRGYPVVGLEISPNSFAEMTVETTDE